MLNIYISLLIVNDIVCVKNNTIKKIKCQMHFRLRELASPSNSPLYPNIDINDDTLNQSLFCFEKYEKSKYISSYYVTCNVKNCIIRIFFVDAL